MDGDYQWRTVACRRRYSACLRWPGRAFRFPRAMPVILQLTRGLCCGCLQLCQPTAQKRFSMQRLQFVLRTGIGHGPFGAARGRNSLGWVGCATISLGSSQRDAAPPSFVVTAKTQVCGPQRGLQRRRWVCCARRSVLLPVRVTPRISAVLLRLFATSDRGKQRLFCAGCF